MKQVIALLVKFGLNFNKQLILLYGITLLIFYTILRFQLINNHPQLIFWGSLLFLAELHTILHLFGFFYSIWPREYYRYSQIYKNSHLQINIFICVCGEPENIVRLTIESAKKTVTQYCKIIHPYTKPKIIVLNDGLAAKKENWEDINRLAAKLKVSYLTRTVPGGFKAGNINNALKNYPSSDPHNTLDIILDADYMAKEEFLLEITKPFVDQKVDFVQTPQRYRNEDTWVAKGASAHQVFFFDHLCPIKGKDNAIFLCGTNFAIRREALDEVGGLDERFITEDYATSIKLHNLGKKGVYISEVLAQGLAPSTLKDYFNQQRRWSKGNLDANGAYLKEIIFGNLTLKQKLHYLLSATYYLIGLRDIILITAPLPYLFLGAPLVQTNTFLFLALVYTPMIIYNIILYHYHFRYPWQSLILNLITFPVYITSFISSITKKNLGFIVTGKMHSKDNPWQAYKWQIITAAILLTALFYNHFKQVTQGPGIFFNYFWAIYYVFLIFTGIYFTLRENYNLHFFEESIERVVFFMKRSAQLMIKPVLALMTLVIVTNNTMILSITYGASPNIKTLTQQKKLLVPLQGAYYGYYLDNLDTHPQNPTVNLLPEEKPSMVMFYQDWGEGSNFDTKFMETLSNENVIPVVTWEPWDPKKWNPQDGSLGQSEYSPKNIANGQHDQYIRNWAKSAAEYKKPFFLRFAHEMNGNWYPWGNVNNNTPEDYKKMWIHVYNIFKEAGATNVIWVWAPNNTDKFGQTNSIFLYYPGSKYVDWVGFSGFNWGLTEKWSYWASFKDLAGDIYEDLSRLGKPIMVAETSTVGLGGNKALWLTQTLTNDIPSMKNIKAVIFYSRDYNPSSSANRKADFDLADNNPAVKRALQENLLKNNFYLRNPSFIA